MLRAVFLMLALAVSCGTPLFSHRMPGAAAQEATPSAECVDTSEKENQALVQRYYDAVSAFDLDAFDEVLAPVVIQHAADVADGQGIEQVKTNIGFFLVAFPDLRHEIEQWVTDGDFVAARVIQSGTQEGDFLGIPATGRDAVWTVIGIWRIECGRIVEHWVEVDQVSRLQQLGAFPMLGRPAATPESGAGEDAVAASPAAECAATTEEENADLVRRWYQEVWTGGNVDTLDEMIAPDHIHHRVLNRVTTGADARVETIQGWRTTLPDLVTTPEFLLTDGDRVVARWIASGTHEGPWEEIAPTGNRVTWTGNTIFRIACGRIAEEWSEAASLAFFQQLGVAAGPPAPVPEATPGA